MNTVIFLVFVAVLVDSAILLHPTRVKRWSVQRTMVEPAPGLSAGDLADVLATSPDIRYSDRIKHLTTLKNGKFKACFIVDFDPDFYLMEAEMDKITTERIPEVADTPPRYYAFLKKAGPFLTAMCQQMDIYWLNAVAPPLPPGSQPISGLPVPGKDAPLPVNHRPPIPPPLHPNPRPYFAHPDPPTPLPVGHHPPTPPPVEIYRQEENHKDVLTPPPIDLYHEQLANQNAHQDEGQAKTPPPIDLYREQQLANQNARQDDRQMRTPPPLALWKLQQEK